MTWGQLLRNTVDRSLMIPRRPQQLQEPWLPVATHRGLKKEEQIPVMFCSLRWKNSSRSLQHSFAYISWPGHMAQDKTSGWQGRPNDLNWLGLVNLVNNTGPSRICVVKESFKQPHANIICCCNCVGRLRLGSPGFLRDSLGVCANKLGCKRRDLPVRYSLQSLTSLST